MIHPVMGALGKRGKARKVHCLKRCDIVMGLKAAANQFDELRANGPHSPW
jgi:hypothetical protein